MVIQVTWNICGEKNRKLGGSGANGKYAKRAKGKGEERDRTMRVVKGKELG